MRAPNGCPTISPSTFLGSTIGSGLKRCYHLMQMGRKEESLYDNDFHLNTFRVDRVLILHFLQFLDMSGEVFFHLKQQR